MQEFESEIAITEALSCEMALGEPSSDGSPGMSCLHDLSRSDACGGALLSRVGRDVSLWLGVAPGTALY